MDLPVRSYDELTKFIEQRMSGRQQANYQPIAIKTLLEKLGEMNKKNLDESIKQYNPQYDEIDSPDTPVIDVLDGKVFEYDRTTKVAKSYFQINKSDPEREKIIELCDKWIKEAIDEKPRLDHILKNFEENFRYYYPDRPSKKEIEKMRQDFVNDFPIEKIPKLSLEEYAEGYKDSKTGKKSQNSFSYRIGNLPTFGSINTPYGMYIYGIFIRAQTQQPDYDKKKFKSTKDAFDTIKKYLVELFKAGEKGDIKKIEEIPLISLFKSKILTVYFPEKYLNIHSREAMKKIVKDLRLIDDVKHKSLFELEQILINYKNDNEKFQNLTNNEFGHLLWVFYDKGTTPKNKKFNQISVFIDEFSRNGVDQTHLQVLKKFHKLRGKYLNSSKIYGVWTGKGESHKKLPLPADKMVEKPHYLHNLTPGVFKPAESDYAQAINLNPQSRYDLEIDRNYPTLRINYNFKDPKKSERYIRYLEKCFEIGLPVGLLFCLERDKYKVLGLGKIVSHKGPEFVLESYGISDDQSSQLKEKILKDYDTISQDPDLAKIDDVDFVNMFDVIDFERDYSIEGIIESHQGEAHKANIPKIIDFCNSGSWAIPNFQRFFDWDKNMIKKFLNSIFHGYYVGSLLLWEPDKDQEIGVIPIKGVIIDPEKIKTNNIVLDGQQRITSLYYAIKSPEENLHSEKERFFFYIDFNEFFKNEDSEEIIKVYSKEVEADDSFKKLLFPFNQLLTYSEWVRNLRRFLKESNSDFDIERDILPLCDWIGKKLDFIKEKFQIPYITLENIPLNDVIEIFGRINSTGMKLDSFDLLIAILSKYDLDLRNIWEKTAEGFPKIKEYYEKSSKGLTVMQVLSLCHSSSKSCRQKDLLKIYENVANSKEDFIEKWDDGVKFTNLAINYIENLGKDGLGVISKRWLPFEPVIPVFASLLWLIENKFPDKKKSCYEKLYCWYWVSVFANMYSKSIATQKTSDYNAIKNWFETDIVPDYIKQFRNNFDRILSLPTVESNRSSVFRGILSLLALEGANDWDQNRVVLNQSTFKENGVDVDHIFPRSVYKKDPYNESILNKTWLAKVTNEVIKRAKTPPKFIDEMLKKNFKNDRKSFEDTLVTHLINNNAFSALVDDDSEKFVIEREKEILKEIGMRIGSSKTDFVSALEISEKEDDLYTKDVSELLKMDEGLELEFKSTMKYDLRLKQSSKDRVNDILRSVAGFMNRKGGLLIVGYDEDNKDLIGIEQDFPYVGKKKWDSWQNALVGACNNAIGESTVALCLEDPVPVKINGKTLAKIKVNPSDEPVYVNDEIFYLRYPGFTKELKGKELDTYRKSRFD